MKKKKVSQERDNWCRVLKSDYDCAGDKNAIQAFLSDNATLTLAPGALGNTELFQRQISTYQLYSQD
jgi:hypothetical protein